MHFRMIYMCMLILLYTSMLDYSILSFFLFICVSKLAFVIFEGKLAFVIQGALGIESRNMARHVLSEIWFLSC